MKNHESAPGGYVEKVREETQAYVRTLIADHERLRTLISDLETENARLMRELQIVRDEAESSLQHKLREVHDETEAFRARYAELEHHNSNLANLYVASYQLHGTLDREAVIAAMQEIIVNLVGSERFGIFERDEDGRLHVVAAIDAPPPETVADYVAVQSVFATGETWIADSADGGEVVACVPLKLDGRVTGLVVIDRLLAHKPGLEPLDYELFALLGSHAATALYCTALRERMAEGQVA